MEYLDSSQLFKKAIEGLTERQKELSCIYGVLEVLKDDKRPLNEVFHEIISRIPKGYQYPSVCMASIRYEGTRYHGPGFAESKWKQKSDLVVDNHIVGCVEVFYGQLIREVDGSQFLPDEQKMLNTIACRLSDHIYFRRLRKSISMLEQSHENSHSLLEPILGIGNDEHWQWRVGMAELIGQRMDAKRFGVKGLYLIGSAKAATAGPASDIDLLIHLNANEKQSCELLSWLEGWSLCLAELNFQKTGYKTEGLLDIHLITDQDVQEKTSFAVLINASENAARQLPLAEV